LGRFLENTVLCAARFWVASVPIVPNLIINVVTSSIPDEGEILVDVIETYVAVNVRVILSIKQIIQS